MTFVLIIIIKSEILLEIQNQTKNYDGLVFKWNAKLNTKITKVANGKKRFKKQK